MSYIMYRIEKNWGSEVTYDVDQYTMMSFPTRDELCQYIAQNGVEMFGKYDFHKLVVCRETTSRVVERIGSWYHIEDFVAFCEKNWAMTVKID